MKKQILIVLCLLSVFAVNAFADWEVTASWTASPGPNLLKEELMVNDELIATVNAGDTTAVVFTRTDLLGETVRVVSYNTAEVSNAGYVLGTLDPVAAPVDATGGSIIIKWRP
jgi:hypothetical protein